MEAAKHGLLVQMYQSLYLIALNSIEKVRSKQERYILALSLGRGHECHEAALS